MIRNIGLLFLLILPAASPAEEKAGPPPTRSDNVKETLHGVEVVDPYRWLEDQNSPATRKWIEEQQKYTDKVLAQAPGRAAIKKRLGELLHTDSMSTPRIHGGRWFFSKRSADQDMPVFYFSNGPDTPIKVLLDCNTLSTDKSVSAAPLDITDDGKLWIYGLRKGGEDEVEVHIRDVDTQRDLPDVLPRSRYAGVQLTADHKTLYYSRMTKVGPRVYTQPLGKGGAETEIFGQGYGPDKIVGVGISENGKYLLLQVMYGSAARKSEIYIKDLTSDGPITPIVNDVDARFTGQFGGDTLFLQTNWNAPNNRILAVDLKNPARENWKEVARN